MFLSNSLKFFKPVAFVGMIAMVLFWVPAKASAVDDNSNQVVDQLERGPLSASQVEAIKRISIGVVNAHQSQRDDDSAEQLNTLAAELDSQLTEDIDSSKNKSGIPTARLVDPRAKIHAWAQRFQSYSSATKNHPSSWGQRHANHRANLMQRWSDELQGIDSDPSASDRLARIRKLRDSIRLSPYQHPDDAQAPLSPTMFMSSSGFKK